MEKYFNGLKNQMVTFELNARLWFLVGSFISGETEVKVEEGASQDWQALEFRPS